MEKLYKELETEEFLGKDSVIPDFGHSHLYLSERGDFFCFTGICLDGKENQVFNCWPYYFVKKKPATLKSVRSFFQVKNGCILASSFLDSNLYNNLKFKRIPEYIFRLPTVNTYYFGIEKKVSKNNYEYFEENEELTRLCFGLTYSELEFVLEKYAKFLGLKNDYIQYPKLTRSLRGMNFCDLTGNWIPEGFPYITYGNENAFSHVSLHGFYKYFSMLFATKNNPKLYSFMINEIGKELINRICAINDYFPTCIKVTHEYLFPKLYIT